MRGKFWHCRPRYPPWVKFFDTNADARSVCGSLPSCLTCARMLPPFEGKLSNCEHLNLSHGNVRFSRDGPPSARGRGARYCSPVNMDPRPMDSRSIAGVNCQFSFPNRIKKCMIIRYDYKVLPGLVTSDKSKVLRDINNKKTQLSLTNCATRLVVSQGHQTWYHSVC